MCLIGLLCIWQYRRAHNLRLYEAHQDAMVSKNKLMLALNASNSGMWEFKTEQDIFTVSSLNQALTGRKTRD